MWFLRTQQDIRTLQNSHYLPLLKHTSYFGDYLVVTRSFPGLLVVAYQAHFFLMKERLSLIKSREAPVCWCRVFEGSPVTEHSILPCVSPASTSMDSVFVVVFLMIWIPCRGTFHYWEMTYCLSFLLSGFSRERTWEIWFGLSQRKWSWGSGVRCDAGEEGRHASLLGIAWSSTLLTGYWWPGRWHCSFLNCLY